MARYEVPEFGTHGFWVEDDVLYLAYHEGGVRVADVSGELEGNLADQGREMAIYKAFAPDRFAPNAPWRGGPSPTTATPSSATSTPASGPSASFRRAVR